MTSNLEGDWVAVSDIRDSLKELHAHINALESRVQRHNRALIAGTVLLGLATFGAGLMFR